MIHFKLEFQFRHSPSKSIARQIKDCCCYLIDALVKRKTPPPCLKEPTSATLTDPKGREGRPMA